MGGKEITSFILLLHSDETSQEEGGRRGERGEGGGGRGEGEGGGGRGRGRSQGVYGHTKDASFSSIYLYCMSLYTLTFVLTKW